MYVVLGTIRVKPARLTEFVARVTEHAARSLREPGCVRYDVLQDAGDPATICLYEVFLSEAHLHVHHAQDYYREWMAVSRDWRDHSTYSRRVLRNLHPPDGDWPVKS